MKTYEAVVTREGKWWMVTIPELDGVTQARRITEIDLMAREYIAASLDLDLDAVNVQLRIGPVGAIRDISSVVEEIKDERAKAAELELKASREAEDLAKRLVHEHIPLRDVGAILGVSHQRAQQLVSR